MSRKTQAGRRWYEAFAESDAPTGWTAWKDLDTPSKARYARAEKAYLAKLYDAGFKVNLDVKDRAGFTDAEVLDAVKQFVDGITPGEGAILEKVIGLRAAGNQALADMHDRCKRAEEELKKVDKELEALGVEGPAPAPAPPPPSDRVRALVRGRIHLMREAVRHEAECATQEERANVLEALILKAMRGGGA